MGASIAENLAQLNGGLRSTGVRLRLEQRGERLGLRGPFPRRDGQPGLQVQRLSLGLPADPSGLKEALRQLYRLQAELDQGHFLWPTAPAAPATRAPELAAVLERFKAEFFAEPRRRRFPAGSRSTWSAAYLPYLRRLQALLRKSHLDTHLQQAALLTPAQITRYAQLRAYAGPATGAAPATAPIHKH